MMAFISFYKHCDVLILHLLFNFKYLRLEIYMTFKKLSGIALHGNEDIQIRLITIS